MTRGFASALFAFPAIGDDGVINASSVNALVRPLHFQLNRLNRRRFAQDIPLSAGFRASSATSRSSGDYLLFIRDRPRHLSRRACFKIEVSEDH